MLKNQIKIGGHYRARVGANITTVKVDAIRERSDYKGREVTVYDVTNLTTGRKTTFRSAQKFRSEVGRPASPEAKAKHFAKLNAKTEAEQHSDSTLPATPIQEPEKSTTAPPSIAQSTGSSSNGGTTASASPTSPLAALLKKSIEHEQDKRAPHVEVQALAGTGKTTTVVEGIKECKGVKSGLTPSDQQRAVWEQMQLSRHDSIRLSSFSSKITEELKSRLTASGLDQRGCQAQGIHSLGYAAVRQRFGRVSADKAKWVVPDITLDLLGKPGAKFKELQPSDRDCIFAVDQLVSLCKQTLTEPTPEGLDELSSHFDVDLNGGRARVYDLVPQVLEKCKRPRNDRDITFDDMIWLPLVHDLPIQRVDLQIIDESQDLNRMQQELMYRAGHRIVFVGDEHQAIYGFAGADAESMKRMRRTLNGGEMPPSQAINERGCITLPLTVTRRCGKAIVQEARRFVPEYEAHESNPEGLISDAGYDEGPRNYRSKAAAGDFVLCRVNAPLVSQCFRFIKAGRKAIILGKKIGEGLTSLVEKSKARTTPDLISWLGDWLAKEQANENAKRYPSEGRLENLQDRHDCILAFCEGLSEVDGVKAKIASVFTDDKDDRGITLSSVHKSKGLEARRVFLLSPKGCGPRTDKMQDWELQQERNLRYVAVTRAIEELCHVS